ncbi:MAG: hypothetical protein AAGF07_02300 [Patescibacteria group bacterium]
MSKTIKFKVNKQTIKTDPNGKRLLSAYIHALYSVYSNHQDKLTANDIERSLYSRLDAKSNKNPQKILAFSDIAQDIGSQLGLSDQQLLNLFHYKSTNFRMVKFVSSVLAYIIFGIFNAAFFMILIFAACLYSP